MSYRNDHDAALHRVAALESELARLRGEQREEEVPIKPQTRGEYRLTVGLLAGFGVVLCVMGLVARGGKTEEPVAVDEATAPDVAVLRAPVGAPVLAIDEAACLEVIEQRAVADARAADPRGAAPTSAVSLMKRSVDCRLPSVGFSSELQNVTSLITVYYESDPVTADGYGSAEQLWREYHRARARS